MTQKQELKVGELVIIRDYSYALRLGINKCSNNGCNEPNARQQFKVLVTNCYIPTYKFGLLQWVVDTIVMGQTDNIVWLVHSGLVKRVQLEHVWEHGDVFEVKDTGSTLIYLIFDKNPNVCCLYTPGYDRDTYHPVRLGCVKACLSEAKFLFNIKDKL